MHVTREQANSQAAVFGLAAFAALALAAPAARAQAYYVSADGQLSTDADSASGVTSQYVAGSPSGTGDLVQTSYNTSLHGHSSGQTTFFYGAGLSTPTDEEADSTLAGSVSPGSLHAAVVSTASMSPSYAGGYPSNLYANSGSTIDLAWSDTITITSATLTQGTPVTVQFTLMADGSLGVSGESSTGTGYGEATAYFRFIANVAGAQVITERGGVNAGTPDPNGADFPSGTYTTVGSAAVGDSFTIGGSLQFITNAGARFDSPSVVSQVQAGDTVSTFITVLTPDASFTSASAAAYAPAPEPPAVAGLAMGVMSLAGLGLRARRGKANAA